MADEEQTWTRRPALSWLWGFRVQRIDGPAPGLYSLSLFQRGEKPVLILWLTPSQRGAGASRERPKGEAASSFVRRLRTKLENARLAEAHWLLAPGTTASACALELVFARGEAQERVVADFDERAPLLVLLSPDGRALGASDERALRSRLPDRKQPYQPARTRGVAMPADEAELYARGEALLGASVQKGQDALQQQLRAQARAALKRAERKAQAIRGDIERADAAPRLRREGNLLLCNLQSVARGAQAARLLDEAVDPPEWLELALDPARDAQQNAQQRFERARKLERGVAIAQARLADTERECARLRELLASLERPEPDDERLARAERLGLRVQPAMQPAKRREPRSHCPYRTFVGTGERQILVGKGAADNDTLTLTVARPHDHWLHARGVHGAHVIVPRERGAELPPELLLDAAHLAAHFSDVRGEASAEVQHTERRYLRKPKGAAPGSINVDREKVLLLRLEPERLARLLANERT